MRRLVFLAFFLLGPALTHAEAIIPGMITPKSPLNITPASGAMPLTVNFSIDVPKKEGAAYTMDFGDSSSGPMTASCTGSLCTLHATHRYTFPGTFALAIRSTISTGKDCGNNTARAEAIIPGPDACRTEFADVTITGNVVVLPDSSFSVSFTAIPLKGEHPLKTEFTTKGPGFYALDFGQGGEPETFMITPRESENRIEANYTDAGNYTAKLYLQLGAERKLVATLPIQAAISRCDDAKNQWRSGKITPQQFEQLQRSRGCDPNQLYP